MTLEAKTLFIALLVGVAHIVSGIAVLASPSALNVTPLATLPYVVGLIGYGGGVAGTLLVCAGLMAVIGANLSLGLPRQAHGVLFLPQQVLLLLQIWAIVEAIIVGRYADGYIPQGGAWFILTDQIWAFILAVTHSFWLAAFLYGSRDRGIHNSAV